MQTFEFLWSHFVDILGPLVALVGILLTLPVLRKKLTENHISDSLKKIQETNTQIQISNQQLIDVLSPLADNVGVVTEEELKQVYKEIEAGYRISLQGSSDVATLMNYLKKTLASAVNDYNKYPRELRNERFYLFVTRVLDRINYFAVQAVQIPRSSRTIKEALIKDELKKYVTNSHIEKYKYFPKGALGDFHSLHFLQVTEEANVSGINILRRSAFKIFEQPHAVAKLLFFHKFYAPLILKTTMQHFFGLQADLYLIGFSQINKFGGKGEKKIVKLIYSNPDNDLSFVDGLSFEDFQNTYSDDWIKDSGFDIKLGYDITKQGYETIQIQFDREYLEKLNNLNRRAVKNQIRCKKGKLQKSIDYFKALIKN